MTTNNEETAALTLSLASERQAVAINGTRYPLRSPDEFSVVESHRLGRQGRRLEKLMSADTLSEGEEGELTQLLDGITKRILDAPDDVHAQLRDSHRLKICRTFTALQRASLEPAGAKATTGA
jgi:hypothetical protein